MAELAYPAAGVPLPGAVQGAVCPLYSGAHHAFAVQRARQNFGSPIDTSGTITGENRVFFKADASAPEVPFSGAIVRLYRYAAGICDWQGVSDATGYYWPAELEVGVEYYPVAIDPTRTHQVTAAGPVMAVKAD